MLSKEKLEDLVEALNDLVENVGARAETAFLAHDFRIISNIIKKGLEESVYERN